MSSAGYAHTLFLADHGQVFGCGLNEEHQVDALLLPLTPGRKLSKVDKVSVIFTLPITVNAFNSKVVEPEVTTKISCGDFHTVALTNLGNVYAWGRGYTMQNKKRPKSFPGKTNETNQTKECFKTPSRCDSMELSDNSGCKSALPVLNNKIMISKTCIRYSSEILVIS
jgi:alpha-tubulin suppressor-like RCC1 family protein